MKNLTAGLILAFCLSFTAQAQTWNPIETAGPVEGETVTINKPLTQEATNMMIAGGASLNSTATNNTLNISTDISETDTTVPEGQRNHYIAGGAVYNNTAEGNTVNISGATLSGRAVAGGLARTNRADAVDAEKWNTGHANNNTVNITGATIDVNPQTADSVFDMDGNPVAVAGGASQFFVGNAAGNTVNITDSSITGGVVGGLSYVKTTQEEVDNHPDITADRNNNYCRQGGDSSVLLRNSHGNRCRDRLRLQRSNQGLVGSHQIANSNYTDNSDNCPDRYRRQYRNDIPFQIFHLLIQNIS